MKKAKKKRKVGRPSKFTQALADEICISIMRGKPLRRIASQCKIRTETIFSWIQTRPGFSDQYAKAKKVQAEMGFDDIISISDEKPLITTVIQSEHGTTEKTQLDSAGIYRNRLRVDARKWVAAKLLPKKYGDRVSIEASGPEGKPIQVANLTSLSDERLQQLAEIVTQLGTDSSGATKTPQAAV